MSDSTTEVTEPVVETQEVETVTEEVATPTIEELQAQIADLEAAKQKANDEAGKYRKRLNETKAAVVVPEDAISQAKAEEASKWKTQFVKQAASLAFTKEGVEATPHLLRMLDLSAVEVDEDGAVEGLEDQIADLKKSLPQLFTAKEKNKPASKIDASAQGKAPKQTTADQFADAFKDLLS